MTRPASRSLISDLAFTVSERLTAGWCPETGAAAEAQAAELLSIWSQRSARSQPAVFSRRLAWEGLDEAAFLQALTPGRMAVELSPPWAATLEAAARFAADGAKPPAEEDWRDPAAPIPFEALLVPWVEVARRRRSSVSAFAPEAWRDLERWLAERLSGFAAETFGVLLDRFRGGRPDGFAVRLAEAGVGRPTGLYDRFVAEVLADGLSAWAHEFPVLARLLATVVDLWSAHTRELEDHCLAEGGAIRREIFGESGPAGSEPLLVRRIRAGLSDPHNGGRTTHVFTFDNGRRVVYKARSLAMDVAFGRWLAWCNERGGPQGLLDLALHRLLDRGDHGWAEYVDTAPCPDTGAVRRFHLRSGQLLALLHAAGARDAHCENLVADGEHPVLIDLEAWLPPRLSRWLPAPGGEEWTGAVERREHSVLATGLLPSWQPDGPRDDVVDVSGLGGGRAGVRPQPVWRAVHSDAMTRAWRPVATPQGHNVPVLAGNAVAPADGAEPIREGFAAMYRFLVEHREELCAPEGPLADLSGCHGRLIFRPTRAYVRLRERSLRPDACRDAAARGGELEALARVYLDASPLALGGGAPLPRGGSACGRGDGGEGLWAGRPATWPLLMAERRALEQGDVPIFHGRLTGTCLEGPQGESIPDVIARPATEALRDRLRRLGPEDLEEQLGYITAALTSPFPPASLSCEEEKPRTPYLRAAVSLATALRRQAMSAPGGPPSWVGPRFRPGSDTFELAPLGDDLYAGTGGIALFFAALSTFTGGEGRELALAEARRIAARPRSDREGIGGLVGLGARIYTLTALGALLDDEEPAREAHRLAAGLTAERIAADSWLDVTLGTAGALLALLALESSRIGHCTGSSPMDRAAACARHLIAHGNPANGRWAGHRPPETGFAHGLAGIAYALQVYAARSGDRPARAAARQAIAFERRLLCAQSGPAQTTWCRGLPGLALARLGPGRPPEDPESRGEIDEALASTRAAALTPMDHLCCGNLGRAEVLLEAGLRRSDAALQEAAGEVALQTLQRAGARGGFSWLPSGEISCFDPSFWKGAAGAGYTLLRLAAPERLPCVLRLEAPRGPGKSFAKVPIDPARSAY
ncbi:MAG TPA: hypothetical protein DD490_04870 [Acidobacteria bacterium]|nr:hypothetical protein [Acidobacteriota bacterium]